MHCIRTSILKLHKLHVKFEVGMTEHQAGRICWGGGGVPDLVVFSIPLEKSSTTLNNLLDHTFSAFRIAISGTSTVSACRFLQTI